MIFKGIFRPIILSFCISILFHFNTIAQQASGQGSPSNENFEMSMSLQHVTVVVSDFSRSEKFYKNILKLEEIDASWLPENQMFLSAGDGLEIHVGEVQGVEINPSNFNHFAITVSDFDQYLLYLKKNDITYGDLDGDGNYNVQKRPDGVRQTFFQDPDGYWIEINDYKY